MSVVSAIIAFVTALPQLVNLIKEFMTWVNHISGNDPQGYIKSVGEAFSKLNASKTPEEKQDAAKSIAKLISGMP